jgi:hypothetical protein
MMRYQSISLSVESLGEIVEISKKSYEWLSEKEWVGKVAFSLTSPMHCDLELMSCHSPFMFSGVIGTAERM